ncbi:MFS transporter [Amycolatopsis acidicola]|uniref:MFS transporter n=1 Tax=Amycolatopsis acidicola TaxID=2596893 RepID=A0A5N0VH64_9PSEU|nr:MFS transporter [Amycolatopsis acidicola]KAA9164998.1 MFS transporter [Amycolatopsis acidicola]
MTDPGGLFRHAGFRRLWTADLLSQFGDRITVLALPLLAATTLGASAFEVASLRTVQTLAYLVLGLQAGAWCDRIRLRPLLIGTDLGRAIAFGSVPLAAAFGVLTLGQLFGVVAVAGVLAVFFEVGHQTYLPRLIDRGRLIEGNARLQANTSVAAVAAPSAAGFLVQYFGGPFALGLNALSFLWSAGWLGRIRQAERVPRPENQAPLLKQIREGLAFVHRHPLLRPLAETTALGSLSQSFMLAISVVFLLDEIHLTPGQIGLISSTGLLGAVTGALVGQRLAAWIGEARCLWLSGLVLAFGYVLVASTTTGAGVLCYPIGNFLAAGAITVFNILQVSFQQAVTPENLRGRVNATMRFTIFGMAPLGSLLAGIVAETAGTRASLWIAAAGLTLAGLRLLCSPMRRLRRLPDAYVAGDPGSRSA